MGCMISISIYLYIIYIYTIRCYMIISSCYMILVYIACLVYSLYFLYGVYDCRDGI